MKLLTFWIVCCVGLFYFGGCVKGIRKDWRPHRRQEQPPSASSPNDRLQGTAHVQRQNRHQDNWSIYTFSHNHLNSPNYVSLFPVRINIPPNYVSTACPQWIRNVHGCFISYHYYPETTINTEYALPEGTYAATELDDKIHTTTSASDFTEMSTDKTPVIVNRFGDIAPKVDFDVYYNTKTGVDLNLVKPLRRPTIKVPPADHSIGETETSNDELSAEGRPSGSAPGFESAPAFQQNTPISRKESKIRETSANPPFSGKTTRNPTLSRTRPTSPKAFSTTTKNPFIKTNGDDDVVRFDDPSQDAISTENPLRSKPKKSTVRESFPTKIPIIPCTNGAAERTQFDQSFNQDPPIHFGDEQSNTEGNHSRTILRRGWDKNL